MRTRTIYYLIAFTTLLIITCSNTQSQKSNSRIIYNIAAFSNDEWGGGHDIGGGVLVQYEYSKTTTEYVGWNGEIIQHPQDTISAAYYKTTITCHGYGELKCKGYVYYHY